VPISQAPHVNEYTEIGYDEPSIPIIQAPHLKSPGKMELCPGRVFTGGVPCARCALTVVLVHDTGVRHLIMTKESIVGVIDSCARRRLRIRDPCFQAANQFGTEFAAAAGWVTAAAAGG
jgi:hypothetical protein